MLAEINKEIRDTPIKYFILTNFLLQLILTGHLQTWLGTSLSKLLGKPDYKQVVHTNVFCSSACYTYCLSSPKLDRWSCLQHLSCTFSSLLFSLFRSLTFFVS